MMDNDREEDSAAAAAGWSDMPKDVVGHTRVFSFHSSQALVEVRMAPPGSFYVTYGNLFGSQTIGCSDIYSLFRVLDSVAHPRKGMQLPKGASVVPNDDERKAG